nr:immunoglobulin light chain junction region [Macaca mulatta]
CGADHGTGSGFVYVF